MTTVYWSAKKYIRFCDHLLNKYSHERNANCTNEMFLEKLLPVTSELIHENKSNTGNEITYLCGQFRKQMPTI